MVADKHTIPHGLGEDEPMDLCGVDRGGVSNTTEWSDVNRNLLTAVILMAIILIGNMGGLWLAGVIWG